MQRCFPPVAALTLLVAACVAVVLLPGTVRADDGSPSTPDATAQIGIGGIYRPGYWTGVRLPRTLGDLGPVRGVETLDSDGVRVRYRQPQTTAASDSQAWSYIVAGAAAVPLQFYGQKGELLWQGRLTGNALAPATPWIVVIGDSLGMESIGRSTLLGRESSLVTVPVETASMLPDDAAGWDGVDLLIINAAGAEILRQLSERQIGAITDWVSGGGRLFLSLGANGAALLSQSPWVAELAGLPLDAAAIRLDPAALETYVSSQSPLPPLDGYPLPEQGGRTVISGRTTARQPVRLVVEQLVGLGRVVIAAFAPDSDEMAQWPQRTALVARLHAGLLDVETQRRREARTTAAVAYDDLAGQMRSALDRFESHRRTPFSIVSLILLALAALIGPLDYWLINRVLGKPLLGWLSFPFSVLLVSAGVLVLHARSGTSLAGDTDGQSLVQAPGLRSNQIEIIDINAAGDRPRGRGVSFIHIGSSTAERVDLTADLSPVLSTAPGEQGDAGGRAEERRVPRPLTGPYGFPGTTFGGLSIAGENRHLPSYSIDLADDAVDPWGRGAGALAGGPTGFPIAPAGSKGWMSRWTFLPRLSDTSGLSQRRGSELLTGSVVNPLDADLLNGVLVYGNWAYLLPTRLRAGQRIESIDSLRQKNFRWHLSRREALENSSRMDTWDVQMHHDLERLSEVLMFETAIGGRDYTALSNHPLRGLDLSHILAHGHAVLYGRLPEPIFQTGITPERPPVSVVRVILPVAAGR